MEITKEKQTGQQNPATQSHKYYSEQELLNCLNGEHMTVKAVLSLIESNFEKDKAISELTQTVAELTKRISYLEKKTLQKPGRKRNPVPYQGQELTDELLMELIDEGYYKNISAMEKDLGVGKNVLRNRYYKAKEKLRLKRRIDKYGDC